MGQMGGTGFRIFSLTKGTREVILKWINVFWGGVLLMVAAVRKMSAFILFEAAAGRVPYL
jgi:hypothetical protein